MDKVFDLNSPLMRSLTTLANLILLSCAWTIFSIPVITVGPATAAVYYVIQKMVQGENPGILRCFWKGFRDNFKQGMILTLIFGVAAALMYYDYVFSYMVSDTLGPALRAVFVILAVVWLTMVCYAFPLQAQFQNSIKNTLKNALLLGIVRPGKTVPLIALHLIPVAVCLVLPELFVKVLPLWLILAPGGIAFLSMVLLKKIWCSLLERAQAQPEDGTTEA